MTMEGTGVMPVYDLNNRTAAQKFRKVGVHSFH